MVYQPPVRVIPLSDAYTCGWCHIVFESSEERARHHIFECPQIFEARKSGDVVPIRKP